VEFRVNSNRQVLSCDNWFDYKTNLRALYLALDATRKAAQRGILEQFAQAALAMLPEAQRKRPAWEVLGLQPDAPPEVAEAAYKALARKYHPDAGGTTAKMQELNDAIEAFRGERNSSNDSEG
jgi:DnaJ-class molecular chaperone